MMAVNGAKDLGKQERASSENGKQAFNVRYSNFDAVYSVALKDITNAIENRKNQNKKNEIFSYYLHVFLFFYDIMYDTNRLGLFCTRENK